MSFEAVTITWAGRSYIIPANQMMAAIARVEDHITLVELQRFYTQRGGIPFARICNALAEVLAFAGAKGVGADQIYTSMMSPDAGDEQTAAVEAVKALLEMMVPPSAKAAVVAAADGKKKNSRPAVARLSKRRTKTSSRG